MKQQCYLVAIYLNWLLLVGGVGCLLYIGRYGFAMAWLIFVPLVLWLYIRVFPSISQSMGYGEVHDHPAQNITDSNQNRTASTVTLYTALGCPFCPIVEKRLSALRKRMSFELKKIDVTLRPDLLSSKGIRAVPVIEVGERRLQGNASSEQLSELICGRTALLGSR